MNRRAHPNWPCALLMLCMTGLAPSYSSELEGKLVFVGSDTLAQLVTAWSVGFKRSHPGVSVALQAGGSSATPTALVRGTANVGSMSRRMTLQEQSRIIAERGTAPLELPLGIDTMAIIVNKDNPIDVLSMETIARIFGRHACGKVGRPVYWKDVGVRGGFGEYRIEPFGRTIASGTYELFRNLALCGGDPDIRVGESPGNAALIETVAHVQGAIGYVGMGFVDPRVKIPSLDLGGGELVTADKMSSDARYPFNRTLYLYFPLTPRSSLPALECEFVRYIRSEAGRQQLVLAGFQAPADDMASALAEVGCKV